jgi:hypothetical protein
MSWIGVVVVVVVIVSEESCAGILRQTSNTRPGGTTFVDERKEKGRAREDSFYVESARPLISRAAF